MDIIFPDSSVQKVNPEKIFAAARETFDNNRLICILNDYDLTVSDINFGNGANPFLTRIYPQTAFALSYMEKNGAVIGAVSNRSGVQVAKRYINQRILHPFIMGTYGMELYLPDYSNASKGSSIIDERYDLFHTRITEISAKVRQAFFETCQVASSTTLEAEMEIITPFGKVYLENKGISPNFPQGLSQVYNLNEFSLESREKIVDSLISSYQKAQTVWEEMSGDELSKIWGVREFGDLNDKSYSWSLSPLLEEGKLFGVTKILSAIENIYKKHIGFILYGGDEDADSEAMIGLGNIKKLTVRSASDALNVFGVWVNPGSIHQKVVEACDIEVKGVSGYADFLTKLSQSF